MPKQSLQQNAVQIALNGRLITAYDPTKIFAIETEAVNFSNFSKLTNMRYTDNGIIGVSGMTKINTSALAYPKIRSMYHFKKDSPAESHLLVRAFNSGETDSKVYRNSNAIPDQGNFNSTELHTDASGAGKGRFSSAPLSHVCYCNEKETMVWGGDEVRIPYFKVYNPNNSWSKDYTSQVQNTLTDSLNVATLKQSAAAVDSDTMLMLHLDGTDGGTTFTDDSPTTPHTVVGAGTAQTDTDISKFGTASLLLNGSTDWLSIADDADFDCSGGVFTRDCWVRVTTLATDNGIYSQGTDANNYMFIYIDTNGAVKLDLNIAGSIDIALTTANSVISVNTWHHIAVVENGDDWYIFVDGAQRAYIDDSGTSSRPADYTGSVFIGATNDNATTTKPFTGNIDEFRASDVARWVSNFDVPTSAYGTDAAVHMLVANNLPLQGIKFYVETANSTAGTLSAYYWSGSGWTAVGGLSDGTASGGIPFAQSGTVSFTSTEDVAKPSIIDGLMAYWYRIEVTLADESTTISRITLDEPFQKLVDLWDGEPRKALGVQKFEDSIFKDNTVNVLEDSYTWDNTTKGNVATFMEMKGLLSTEYVLVGFSERMIGLQIKMVPETANATATVMTVDYWDGENWIDIGAIQDGTDEGGKSLSKSGIVTWNGNDEGVEFKKQVSNEAPLYYYRLRWDNQLTTTSVLLYHINGIAAPLPISNYKFSLHANDILFLCADMADEKNKVIPSVPGTLNRFNGAESDPIYFGDGTEIVAAAELFTRTTSSLQSNILFCKKSSSYVLTGDSRENWTKPQLSNVIGCTAPYSMAVSSIGLEFSPLQAKSIVIWQGSGNIYMFDSISITPIGDDIKDIFDQNNSYAINPDKISDSVGEFDNNLHEYHFKYASGTSTTLDKELVFDVRRQRWYEVDRASGKRLQVSASVGDTSGGNYLYGGCDGGYVYRLENGTDFDGNTITHDFKIGDIAVGGNNILIETLIDTIFLPMVSKTVSTKTITGTYYKNTKTSGKTFTLTGDQTGYRIVTNDNARKPAGSGDYRAIFHGFEFSVTNTDENIGFEPLYLGLQYSVERNIN